MPRARGAPRSSAIPWAGRSLGGRRGGETDLGSRAGEHARERWHTGLGGGDAGVGEGGGRVGERPAARTLREIPAEPREQCRRDALAVERVQAPGAEVEGV